MRYSASRASDNAKGNTALATQAVSHPRRRLIASAAEMTLPVDLSVAKSEDLQQGHGFLSLLVGRDILNDQLCFSVLRDHQRLPLLGQAPNHLCCIRFVITDRLDLR
jgi:hypothetical protein